MIVDINTQYIAGFYSFVDLYVYQTASFPARCPDYPCQIPAQSSIERLDGFGLKGGLGNERNSGLSTQSEFDMLGR